MNKYYDLTFKNSEKQIKNRMRVVDTSRIIYKRLTCLLIYLSKTSLNDTI